MESWIAARIDGQSRREAAGHLSAREVPEKSLRQLEKWIHTTIHQAKVLFSNLASEIGESHHWLKEAAAGNPRPTTTSTVRYARSSRCTTICDPDKIVSRNV